MEKFNVLSLFDGCSGGQQALDRLGIKVDNYYASEIDKYAIQVTMANYPNTIQLGSVIDVDVSELPTINLLCGGSPCQSFSFAGKRKGMSTKDSIEILTLEHYLELKSQNFEFEGQSYLFWEYMRVLMDATPKYFLLENVMMGEKWEKILSKAIGITPLCINSSLVSAQNRKRLYWFGQIRERLFYNDNYCYICRYEQENRGIQDKSQSERSREILGNTQGRQINLQNLRIGISENTKEGNDKNLFYYMSREKQKVVRQKQVQNNEKELSERISEKEQRKNFRISKEISSDGERERVICKNGGKSIEENSQNNEDSSTQGINWTKEEAEQRRIDYYSKYGEEMCCVCCGKRLNHRPQTSFVKGWDKLDRKSPSTLSEVQFNEARQNNGRVFDILEIGVTAEDMFGEIINHIPQPKDKGILLKDILESEVDEKYYLSGVAIEGILKHKAEQKEKGFGFGAVIKKEDEKMNALKVGGKGVDDLVEIVGLTEVRTKEAKKTRRETGSNPKRAKELEARTDGKTGALLTSLTNDNLVLLNDRQLANYKDDNEKANTFLSTSWKGSQANGMTLVGNSRIRRLTPIECERLQQMVDNYTQHVSDSQRYKMIGNGWSIDVIAHVLSFMK